LERRELSPAESLKRRLAAFAFSDEQHGYDLIERKVYPGDPDFDRPDAMGVSWRWLNLAYKVCPPPETKDQKDAT
jgi:hypothetical protein